MVKRKRTRKLKWVVKVRGVFLGRPYTEFLFFYKKPFGEGNHTSNFPDVNFLTCDDVTRFIPKLKQLKLGKAYKLSDFRLG